MTDYHQLTIDSLHLIVKIMDGLSEVGPNSYKFDAMTASVIWYDELPERRGSALDWGLRPLFGYRGSLILSEPDLSLEPYWLLGKELFPNWVGFRPERCVPNPELAAFIREQIALEIAS